MKHLNLQDGERVEGYARQHPVVVAVPLVFEIGSILLAFFFMTPLLGFGAVGAGAFVLWVLASAFLAFRSWLLWYSNVFVITNRRIVDLDRRGIFHWVVSESIFVNIQDISWNQKGMIETMFSAGSVIVQTASGFVNLEIRFVKDPARVSQAIKDARDAGVKTAPETAGESLAQFSGLDQESMRALSKYANHLRSRRAFKEFIDEDEAEGGGKRS